MTTAIKEFSPIEAAISVLRERFNFIPSCHTPDELKKTKQEYKEIRKYEIDLDNKRLELTSDLREQKKEIDNSAGDIDKQLKTISKPFKDAIDKRVQELKDAEQKRMLDIRTEITSITNFVYEATGKDSNSIAGIIEAVDMIEADEHFQEFQAEARETLNNTKAKLAQLLSDTISKETTEKELEKERAEREEEQAELAQLRKESEERKAQDLAKNREPGIVTTHLTKEQTDVDIVVVQPENDIPFVDQDESVPCETPVKLPEGEDIKGFLEFAVNDNSLRNDFGYLLISTNAEYNAEALHNIKAKFANYVNG